MGRVWRLWLVALLLGGGVATAPAVAVAQEGGETTIDLAAVPLSPEALSESGFQFATGGYQTEADVVYGLERDHGIGADETREALEAAGWQTAYTRTLVLLEDRAIRTSAPLVSVETTIHRFDDADGAERLHGLMTASPPPGADVVDGPNGVTWRVVTSQHDRLVTLATSGEHLVQVTTADATGRPDAGDHELAVEGTLDRLSALADVPVSALSTQMVPLTDDRLVPLSIGTEEPLVHRYYRLLDGAVLPVAGELDPPSVSDLPAGAERIVIARQTAELASQTWLTGEVALIAFDASAPADAFATDGMLGDSLDTFALGETASDRQETEAIWIEAIRGDSILGVPYTGFRLTVVEGHTVAQITVRVSGNAVLDRGGVERWADAQRSCLAGAPCVPIPLTDLLATPDPATPVATDDAGDGLYRSPVASWQVAFDTDLWRVEETVAEGGYDYLYLRSDRMDATFETIVDQHGDPERCILGELDRLRDLEDRAAITLGSDDDEPPGGMDAGHAWVIYTVEPLEESRADEEYTIRIDCYTVEAGTTSLVVQTRAPRDVWPDVTDDRDALRDGISIDTLLNVPMMSERIQP